MGVGSKSWWEQMNRYSLDSFVCNKCNNIVKKHLGIRGLHLGQYSKASLAMSYIAVIKKLRQDGIIKNYIKQKLFDSA